MSSAIVAGSTYLLAPPPPKSYPQNPLLASLLCHPLGSHHPQLLLQLQRKDPSNRHAYPQFDLLGRKPTKPSKHTSPTSTTSPALANDVLARCKPREVLILQSENGHKVATIKYLSTLNAGQKRKAGILPSDESAIAVMYWNYSKQLTKIWTVHTYEGRKRSGLKCTGYEFRLSGNQVPSGREVIVRWVKKIQSQSASLNERDRPMTFIAPRRSSISSETSSGPRRRHTFSHGTTPSTPAETKWEFSSPNVRRIMATMTLQKLHIHSISSNATPLSSPSTSSLDSELPNDRLLTPGKMMEILVISSLFVGLEDDFAGKLRAEFMAVGGLRIPRDSEDVSSDEYITPPSPVRTARTPTVQTPDITTTEEKNVLPHTPADGVPANQRLVETKKMEPLLTLRGLNLQPSGFYEKGWRYVTAAAATCMTKLMKSA